MVSVCHHSGLAGILRRFSPNTHWKSRRGYAPDRDLQPGIVVNLNRFVKCGGQEFRHHPAWIGEGAPVSPV
jgi:hypothetical protein